MAEFSVDICRQLANKFAKCELHRPMRIDRYDPGDKLWYDVRGVFPDVSGRVLVEIDKFVGGGFAGQVYRVKVLEVQTLQEGKPQGDKTQTEETQGAKSDSEEIRGVPKVKMKEEAKEKSGGAIEGMVPGSVLAMKILIPPSGFSLLFRNVVYAVGFQGPFQLQVNPTAARAGALWQKFIRRAAAERFGDDNCVTNIYATFVDEKLGSCGEFSEWINGRTWRLEVDDRLDLLKKWKRHQPVDESKLGSPEYRAKHRFMHELVSMLHEMGAPELARQYEWTTCKSQPNCLKQLETGDVPDKGLTAVDFRAGLALLPFLPMSPGDFKLIFNGLTRGSLVQFDRGDADKLRRYMQQHSQSLGGMEDAWEQLKHCEEVYRNSLPDITHNHVRLLYSRKLWGTIFSSAVTGWKVRQLIDDQTEKKLRISRSKTFLFFVLGLIPLLGRFLRKVWGRRDYRQHYGDMLSSLGYFRRAVRGRIAEKVAVWYRQGRMSDARSLRVADSSWRFIGHMMLSILPVGLHRVLTDAGYARQALWNIFVRPLKLYFNADMREQWLRDMLKQGQSKHSISDEDAEIILSQLHEPFIQKYLKSLAVHVCTLPVTQIVSVLVAWWYVVKHPEMSKGEQTAAVTAILALFQITPISPGSFCRGLYVVYLVIKERNFKDYNIAVFMGFMKYIGYLSFPIQMAYKYPVLARFMAGHWATGAVHIVPVFGESGALLEHWVFNLFYNVPLTIRRRMGAIEQYRSKLPVRKWHAVVIALIATGILWVVDNHYANVTGRVGNLKDLWWLLPSVAILIGIGVTRGAGGAALARRIIMAVIAAGAAGLLYGLEHLYLLVQTGSDIAKDLGATGTHSAAATHSGHIGFWAVFSIIGWRIFAAVVIAAIAALITEIKTPEPAGNYTQRAS